MARITRFTELAAWQRGQELLLLCEELLKRPRLRFQKRFREQLSDASASVPRNVAEGFGRYRPRENAQYVRVAKGSANEVLSLFYEARARGFLTPEEFPRFETAADRAIGTLINYLRYLESCKPPGQDANPKAKT
jgi:four helix bundle protein